MFVLRRFSSVLRSTRILPNKSHWSTIGVAVLVSQQLRNLGTSLNVTSITDEIRYAHYRPVESSNHSNRRWITGHPDDFGRSTWIRLADAPMILSNIFRDSTKLKQASFLDADQSYPSHDVVLVGHGVGNDEKYLRRLTVAFQSKHLATLSANVVVDIMANQLLKYDLGCWLI